MRYKEITKKEKQEYSLEELTAELKKQISKVLNANRYSAAQKLNNKNDS
jgi:hypothetical protein